MKKELYSAYHDSPVLWKDLLSQGLRDDEWQSDWTTLGTLKDSRKKVSARVIAKSSGVWAGDGASQAAEQLAHELGYFLEIKNLIENGEKLKSGVTISRWSGSARMLLALERPYLNLVAFSGGIATATARLVGVVEKACPKNPPRVVPTRKTLPGYRNLAVHAVQAGGGYSHRTSLAGGVLIKENHIASAGGVKAAIEGVRKVAPHGLKIEVEVTQESELKQALEASADIVMLDNFSPSQVKSALKLIDRAAARPWVEVSGGLNESNIAQYAIAGVDVLSVGALTHSVNSIDLSLLIEK